MDSLRFDAMTRGLARRFSRRSAVAAGSASLLGGLALRDVAAQDATPVVSDATPVAEGTDASFLFVQTATSGSFRANPGAGTPEVGGTPTPGGGAQYLLTLEGHAGGTVYFSDRPERVFGDAPTGKFLDGLGFSPDNPPNAAIVTQSDQGEDVAVVELVDPVYDEASGTLTYGANVLDEYEGDGLTHVAAQQQDASLPEQFDRASLFIDDCADQVWACYPRTGPDPNAPAGYITIGRCWSWDCVCCDWSNCSGSDPDSMCNQSGFDCGDEGCLACTTSPIAVATGEGGECI